MIIVKLCTSHNESMGGLRAIFLSCAKSQKTRGWKLNVFRGQHFTRPLSKSNVHSTKSVRIKSSLFPGASQKFSGPTESREGEGKRERWWVPPWQLPEGRGRLDYVRLMRGDRAKPHRPGCGDVWSTQQSLTRGASLRAPGPSTTGGPRPPFYPIRRIPKLERKELF